MRDYTMRLEGHAGATSLARRFHVTVLDGTVRRVARTDVQPVVEMGPEPGFAVEDLFALVAEAMERAHAHSVRYDEELGHPIALDVTWEPHGLRGPSRYRASLHPIR